MEQYLLNRSLTRLDSNKWFTLQLDERNDGVTESLYGAIFTYPIDDFNRLLNNATLMVNELSMLLSGDVPVHQGIILDYNSANPLDSIILHYGADEDNQGPIVERFRDVHRIKSKEINEVKIYPYTCLNASRLSQYVTYDALTHSFIPNREALNTLYHTISNGTMEYNIIKCNCQHFVNAALDINNYNQGNILSDTLFLYSCIGTIVNNNEVMNHINSISQ